MKLKSRELHTKETGDGGNKVTLNQQSSPPSRFAPTAFSGKTKEEFKYSLNSLDKQIDNMIEEHQEMGV